MNKTDVKFEWIPAMRAYDERFISPVLLTFRWKRWAKRWSGKSMLGTFWLELETKPATVPPGWENWLFDIY